MTAENKYTCRRCGGTGEEPEARPEDAISAHVAGLSPNDPKNWTEDYPHENGNYICRCSECGNYFLGHKRRAVCRECATKDGEAE